MQVSIIFNTNPVTQFNTEKMYKEAVSESGNLNDQSPNPNKIGAEPSFFKTFLLACSGERKTALL
jgi:hypothetical protein